MQKGDHKNARKGGLHIPECFKILQRLETRSGWTCSLSLLPYVSLNSSLCEPFVTLSVHVAVGSVSLHQRSHLTIGEGSLPQRNVFLEVC